MKAHAPIIIGVAIILAVGILAYTWYSIETNRQNQETEQQRLKQQEATSEASKENLNSSLLQSCLDNATELYPWENVQKDSQRDPNNTQDYLDLYYKNKSEAESSCKIRYPQ